jgi:plastocyanin
MTVHVENEDGMYNPDLLVYYSTNDVTRAGIDRFWAYLDARKPGPVMVYAQTTAYGVTYIDSTEITITYPIEAMVMIYPSTDIPTSDPYFIAPILTIQRGGTVYWINSSQREIDVTFTDSTHVDGGNIAAVPVDGAEGRTFPTPGTYDYRSVKYGTSGRIVVKP